MYIIDTLRFQHFNAKSRVHKQVNKQEFLQTTNTNNYSNGDSSPLTRETLAIRFVCDIDIRLIPAYAGNTDINVHINSGGGDHPRLRGKHFMLSSIVKC